MAVSWNWVLLDEHVATGISAFTEAGIPELINEQAEFWQTNLFLNSTLRASFVSPAREYAFTFVRRSAAAFEEYHLAAVATERFAVERSEGGQPIARYRSALHHWEQCVAQAWQAIEVWRKITGQKAFELGDGSADERLHHVYNRSKHTDKAIAAAQMPSIGPLAMWLSNAGLRTTEVLLAWGELHEVLVELGKAADLLSDPHQFVDPERGS